MVICRQARIVVAVFILIQFQNGGRCAIVVIVRKGRLRHSGKLSEMHQMVSRDESSHMTYVVGHRMWGEQSCRSMTVHRKPVLVVEWTEVHQFVQGREWAI